MKLHLRNCPSERSIQVSDKMIREVEQAKLDSLKRRKENIYS